MCGPICCASAVHKPRTHGKLFAERAAAQGISLVPPDGGWGWAIVSAFAISHFFVVPFFPMFGLIFADKFRTLGISAADINLILSVNSAVGFGFDVCMMAYGTFPSRVTMIVLTLLTRELADTLGAGLMHGPLLRRFSVRQLSVCGSLLMFGGAVLLVAADTFFLFMLAFGIIFALGFSLMDQPQNLAVNSYFRDLRGRAVSLSMGICGFGPVLVPLLMRRLLEWYGTRGAMLLLAAFLLHSLPASALLQPVHWHMRKPTTQPDTLTSTPASPAPDGVATNEKTGSPAPDLPEMRRRRARAVTEVSEDCYWSFAMEPSAVQQACRPLEPSAMQQASRPLRRAVSSVITSPSRPAVVRHTRTLSLSQHPHYLQQPSLSSRWTSLGSSSVFTNSAVHSLETIPLHSPLTQTPMREEREESESSNDFLQVHEGSKKPSKWVQLAARLRRHGLKVVDFFDLRLFCLPGYPSLVVGMSIAMFADITFSLLFPTILGDMNQLAKPEIFTVMSVMGGADIGFRFIAPNIGKALRLSHRSMYVFSLVIYIIMRSMLMLFRSYVAVLVLACGMGLAKGLRSVYMPLVIPSHVEIDRLAAAVGLQMVCNCLLFLAFGFLLGKLRDVSGSYWPVLLIVNLLSLVTVLMWTGRDLARWLLACCCRWKEAPPQTDIP